MNADDPFDLRRFEVAQAPLFETALAELRAARKRSHWMWFIFPQLRGLGHSPMADRYGIGSLDEARAYLAHPILGPRLALCTGAMEACAAPSAHAVFGTPDDVKFHSSMTLFALTAPGPDSPYHHALDRWFAGRRDDRTLARLAPTG